MLKSLNILFEETNSKIDDLHRIHDGLIKAKQHIGGRLDSMNQMQKELAVNECWHRLNLLEFELYSVIEKFKND